MTDRTPGRGAPGLSAVVALAAAGVEGDAVTRACRTLGSRASPRRVAALLAAEAADRGDGRAVAARLAALGAEVLVAGSLTYPRRLAAAWPEAGAPLWLFVRAPGGLLPDVPTVAVVGTRRPTLDGLATARLVARRASAAGAAVVSGLARGIDQAAHEGALEAGGPTVGVLGTGFGVDYPSGSATLRRRVAGSGGIVSELVPGCPPRPYRFLHRNRIIAGLADVTVVVEGGVRSGALTTAKAALEQGREVLACPASLQCPQGAGPLELLRDGARPVTDPADVLDALGILALATEDRAAPRGVEVGAEAEALLALLSATPISIDGLASGTGQPVRVVLGAVVELVTAGLAQRSTAGVVRVPNAPGTR